MYKQIVVLRAVYDDSDIQTDYFNRDRNLDEWFVADLEGTRVTESKLRRALELLPFWLREFDWAFQKGEKYSMSDHYYGQLRVDEGVDLKIKGDYTYSHYDRSVRFILTASSLGRESIGVSKEQMPQSLEEMRQLIERRQQKWKEQRAKAKEHITKAMPEVIQSSHAIIDGKGFRVLTQEEKDRLKQKYTKPDVKSEED